MELRSMKAAAFEAGELLDEAATSLLSASPDVPRTAPLIGKLRTWPNQSGDNGLGQKLRDVADKLEQRMLAT